jgi:esterase/lipase superfamily enzyme
MRRATKKWATKAFRVGLAAALAAALGHPAPAAAADETAGRQRYQAVTLEDEGAAGAAALEGMVEGVRSELDGDRGQVVVMVHGFNVARKHAEKDYRAVAGRLRAQAEEAGLELAVVGVHWNSGAGSLGKWLPAAVGSRLTSLLGMKKAVKNPYLEKVKTARASGRTGLRAVLFRLQEEFPGTPVHLFAHSLGAEVAVSALCPHLQPAKDDTRIEQPDRILRVGMVTLVGADLDQDVFTRRPAVEHCMVLDRADVWWVTVPEKGHADGVLELRLGAGRSHAVGNKGLKLEADELGRLLARRALVVDQGRVPATHVVTDYFHRERVRELTASMLYLENPEAPAAQKSILAALDRVLQADQAALASFAESGSGSTRLYAMWRRASGAPSAPPGRPVRTTSLTAAR